jgi:hypothetical protein
MVVVIDGLLRADMFVFQDKQPLVTSSTTRDDFQVLLANFLALLSGNQMTQVPYTAGC